MYMKPQASPGMYPHPALRTPGLRDELDSFYIPEDRDQEWLQDFINKSGYVHYTYTDEDNEEMEYFEDKIL